ncbi:hypothetical protein KL906_002012 [Ogataea polymorpha]|nr:hypothetical protein KL937_004844 [Ogataea polymorpha]KAG7886318.1 hypothetical protein KL936_004996 [Ogataea polymorpha]KAG7894386.1 hypothetical protein KL908_001758 [Ogataea polymorpha]KAG7910107.1 hypothetical protein KL906_002012 [Ogataea polymorpha]KAG7930238.1 hypothetical protein KL934_004932 [Ogataea polymorpha]
MDFLDLPPDDTEPLSITEEESVRASLSKALNRTPTIPENADEDEPTAIKEYTQPESASSRRGTITGSLPQSIDKKRKDNMNEKIYELYESIPSDLFVDSKDKSSGTKDGKPNKGQILSKAVEYISKLQADIDEKNRKEVELSIRLRNLEIAQNVPASQRFNLLHTSAELGLAKIGVGPLAQESSESPRP